MRRCIALLIPLVFAATAHSAGQTDSKAKELAAKPSEVEARLQDGSAIRVVVLQENLEIMTKYGKLTVPMREIRRIDFGFRLAPDLEKSIEVAIKGLGDRSHEVRETASKDLLAIGARAYPALQRAAKSPDAEVARRAEQAIQQLRDKTPADQLRFSDRDRVLTPELPIAGRILTATLKVRTSYFGDAELKLTDLRSLRWLGSDRETEVTVDAAKYGSPPSQWLDTSIQVDGDTEFLITASGQVDLWPQGPGQYVTGPGGYGGERARGAHAGGALLGRIGENGKVFVIGERYEGTADRDGKLYLQIGVSPWGNASTGAYGVKIVQGGAAVRR